MSGAVLRRSAVPVPVRTRRNLASLTENDPIIRSYSRAIGFMKSINIANPVSWWYQGAIHDFPFPDGGRDITAFRTRVNPAAPADTPLPADRGTYWRQCRHASWLFLPWHRMYLGFFERIIRSIVARDGGPSDWALPYWDWAGGTLPDMYRRPTFRDGTTNHLYTVERNRGPDPNRDTFPIANNGDVFADEVTRDQAMDCLKPDVFANGTNPPSSEFGGPAVNNHAGLGPPTDDVQNPDLRTSGRLEARPHGSMHTATGGVFPGRTGWMSTFSTAALDPIFWSHHANIDRLWEIWIQSAPIHKNPEDPRFVGLSFPFHGVQVNEKGELLLNERGEPLTTNETISVRDVLQTRKPPLSYEYDDTTKP